MPTNNIKIGLDLEKLKTLNSGLGQFGLHLAQALDKTIDDHIDLEFYLPENATTYFPNHNITLWKRLHQFTKIPIEVDVWHSLHQEAKYFPKKYRKLVVTIHDLNFLDKYEGSKLKRKLKQLQELVTQADGITFISNYTKEIANQHLNFGTKPQRVIYNGLTLTNPDKQVKPNNLATKKPFLFSIGIVSAKKNFHTLISMMEYLPEFALIIAGNNKSEYAQQIKNKINEKGLSDRIFLIGEISDPEKNWLYKNCQAFVFPSLSEGFGLPVIESFYYGRPTTISNKSSLPEIGKDFTHYFQNFDPKSMASNIERAISTHTPKKSIEQNKYALSYSWNKAAEEYLKFYKEV